MNKYLKSDNFKHKITFQLREKVDKKCTKVQCKIDKCILCKNNKTEKIKNKYRIFEKNKIRQTIMREN